MPKGPPFETGNCESKVIKMSKENVKHEGTYWARRVKTEAKLLTHVASFRLSENDYLLYREKMKYSGLKPSEFFRVAVLTNKIKIVARSKSNTDKNRLHFICNKTSNNLNQLARRVNTDHICERISELTYMQVLQELRAINKYMKMCLQNVD